MRKDFAFLFQIFTFACHSRSRSICKFWTLAFFSFFSSFFTHHGRINFYLFYFFFLKDSVDLACDSFKVQCKLCPKKYVKKKMRNHIGYHIIHGDCSPNSHRCGYCGEIGCQISLVVTSGCGKRVVYGLVLLKKNCWKKVLLKKKVHIWGVKMN